VSFADIDYELWRLLRLTFGQPFGVAISALSNIVSRLLHDLGHVVATTREHMWRGVCDGCVHGSKYKLWISQCGDLTTHYLRVIMIVAALISAWPIANGYDKVMHATTWRYKMLL
jgi:hypothetical protein